MWVWTTWNFSPDQNAETCVGSGIQDDWVCVLIRILIPKNDIKRKIRMRNEHLIKLSFREITRGVVWLNLEHSDLRKFSKLVVTVFGAKCNSVSFDVSTFEGISNLETIFHRWSQTSKVFNLKKYCNNN